jgi:hypothetical protein
MSTVPHLFESITEQEWKSGKNRHRCAVCDKDYSSVVHSLRLLVLHVPDDNYFVPESAAQLVSGLCNLDDESAAMTIKLWVLDLKGELSLN